MTRPQKQTIHSLSFALALCLAACGQPSSAEQTSGGGQDGGGQSGGSSGAQDDPLIRQDSEVTRETSTAEIIRKSDDTGALQEVGEIETFTGESVSPDPGKGIYQKGRGSTARIQSSGMGNAAAIRQTDDTGDGADGSSATIALGNDSSLANNSTAYIDQRGDKGVVSINLQGDSNFAFGRQHANLDGSGTGAEQTHTLAGNEHRSEIIQTAEAATADVTLSQGTGSTGLVRQAQAGSKASIAIKNGAGSQGKVVQAGNGRGNNADIDIDGANNETQITQRSDSGRQEGSVSQTGEKSTVRVVQDGASGNVSSVNQNGAEGTATILQEQSPANKAQIDQEGAASRSLEGSIRQTGSGGQNEADIDQTGKTHSAIIRQTGSGGGSVAGIDQSTDGTDENEATIEQTVDAKSGTDNVDIDQGGSANRAKGTQRRTSGGTGSNISITQPGVRGVATVEQDGPSLKGQIDQNGNANDSTIRQKGSGGSAEASIKTGSGTDNNAAEIKQNSGGTIAAIDQTSANNGATIEQTNPSPSQGTVEADIDQGSDVQNKAIIRQSGAGTVRSASLTQSGRENEGRIEQSGPGNEINATVQMGGNRNSLRLIQNAQGGGSISAELQQGGDENEMTFQQKGSAISATLAQDGDSNVMDITQTGSGYDVSVQQKGNNNTFRITYSGPSEGGGGYSIVQNGGETRDGQ